MSLTDKFTVAVIPLDITLGDKNANLDAVEAICAHLPSDIDLVVLPELFTTAFIDDADKAGELAEPDYGDTIARIKALAAKHKAAFCGSFLAKNAHMLFNRGFIVEPDGEAAFYDKRHLFCLSDESKLFTRGISLPPVVRFRRWNISMVICYDVRFPAWLRNIGAKYDLLVVPANWPDHRAFDWEQMLKVRAIENISYTIGCNRTGSDPYGKYHDTSLLFDYTGHPIGDKEASGIIVARISKDSLEKYRRSRPFLSDADDYVIKMF